MQHKEAVYGPSQHQGNTGGKEWSQMHVWFGLCKLPLICVHFSLIHDLNTSRSMSGLRRKHTAHFSTHSFISALFLDHIYKMPVKSSSWKGKCAKCTQRLNSSPFPILPFSFSLVDKIFQVQVSVQLLRGMLVTPFWEETRVFFLSHPVWKSLHLFCVIPCLLSCQCSLGCNKYEGVSGSSDSVLGTFWTNAMVIALYFCWVVHFLRAILICNSVTLVV